MIVYHRLLFLLLLHALSWSTARSDGGVLSTLSELDALRIIEKNHVTRKQNVDVVNLGSASQSGSDELLGLCHLALMIPFTQVRPNGRFPFPHGFEGAFAISLAAQHLNTGDGSIVPDVRGLNNTCRVRFTVEFFDTELSQKKAVQELIDILNRVNNRVNESKETLPSPLPTAFLGNTRSAVSMATSVITGLAGYPQLSPISLSSELNDKDQHPLFARVCPSSDGNAVPIVKFFHDVLNVQHLCVVHNNDGYGNAYARAILKSAQDLAPSMRLQFINIPVNIQDDDPVYVKVVQFLESTECRYFFAPILNINYEPLMREAYKAGIAGSGLHNWMFSTSVERALKDRYEKDSPLHLATRGICLINVMGGKDGMAGHDNFKKAWQTTNNPDDIKYITSKLPWYKDYGNGVPMMINDGFFSSGGGTTGPFLYDAAIMLGLAACEASKETQGPFFDGSLHYQKVLETTFEGVTGSIVVEESTGNREPDSALFELLNFFDSEEVVEEQDETNNTVVMVQMGSRRPYIYEDGIWNEQFPFIFNDGTSDIPDSLPEVDVNENYIGSELRFIGFALSISILVLSVGFSSWTQFNANTRVVKASQPIFLHIISFGAFLMGLAIIPLSIDDEVCPTNKQCDIACMSMPWLLCMGFATSFAAIFSKTLRINKIFLNPMMKRIQVTPLDVMKPLFATLTANTIILALWTVISPLQWQRTNVQFSEFDQVTESYGSCKPADNNSSSYLPYVIPLVLVNIGVLGFAAQQAYVARAISTEFAESEYIGKALVVIMLVCIVSIPVLIIVNDDPSAYFFVMMAIITVVCLSLLLFIFGPKIIFHRKRDKEESIISGTSRALRKFIRNNYSNQSSLSLDRSLRRSLRNSSNAEESEENGLVIVDHPMMRKNMMTENMALRRRVAELEKTRSVVSNEEEGAILRGAEDKETGKAPSAVHSYLQDIAKLEVFEEEEDISLLLDSTKKEGESLVKDPPKKDG